MIFTPQNRPVPTGLWLLLAVTLTMPFWHLGHPLWEVDDARYAEVPREMVELRDWLTPHLNYVDYVQKPPLMYWLDAASYSVFGISERAARIPLALVSLLGILGIVWMGWWLFSPRVGVYAGIILGTSMEFSLLSHLKTPDMPIAVFLLWTCAFLLRGLRTPRDSRWAGPAAGVCAALAFLSKGLIAFLFPALWILPLIALFPELRFGFRSLLLSWGIPVCLAIVGGWVWMMTLHNPRFPYHFFIEQHFMRYLTSHYNRTGPWYYFIGINLAGLLPWTLLAVAAMALPIARWRDTDSRIRQVFIWIALIFIFFSTSKSKLPTYILPLIPQQCLLAAELLYRLEIEKVVRSWLKAWNLRLGILIWMLIPLALLSRQWISLPAMITHDVVSTGIILLLALGGGILSLTNPMDHQGIKALRRTTLMAFAATALLLTGANRLRAYLSAKDLTTAVQQHCSHADDLIMTYGIYLHGIPFYARRPVNKVINWLGELDYAKQDPRFHHIFGDDDTIRGLPEPGKTACVILRRRETAHFNSLTQPHKIRRMERIGDWVLAVF